MKSSPSRPQKSVCPLPIRWWSVPLGAMVTTCQPLSITASERESGDQAARPVGFDAADDVALPGCSVENPELLVVLIEFANVGPFAEVRRDIGRLAAITVSAPQDSRPPRLDGQLASGGAEVGGPRSDLGVDEIASWRPELRAR